VLLACLDGAVSVKIRADRRLDPHQRGHNHHRAAKQRADDGSSGTGMAAFSKYLRRCVIALRKNRSGGIERTALSRCGGSAPLIRRAPLIIDTGAVAR